MSSFSIRSTPGNKDNSLPQHHDLHLTGDDDSLITVWGDRRLAEYLVFSLQSYGKWAAATIPNANVDNSERACG